jgi:peroxin-14
MATVMGGVGYGIYFTAKVDHKTRVFTVTKRVDRELTWRQRYIVPLIAPPTPPQITQDKTSIDESFEKAFSLLDQLNADTTALKAAEESRTTRLDTSLGELESVLATLKDADRKREEDARRNAEEIRSLRDMIPKALEAQKESSDSRLRELGTELKSLKTLVGNRMSSSGPTPAATHKSVGSGSNIGYTPSSSAAVQNGAAGGVSSPVAQMPSTNGGPVTIPQANPTEMPAAAAAAASSIDRPQSSASSASGRFGSGKAAIPAWQMAAAKKSQEALNGEKKDTSASGTAVEASAS